MTVETQLREYKATLDAATERAASQPIQHVAPVIRMRPARTLLIAVAAVAAVIAVAFAAVGLTHKSATPPATAPAITLAPPTTVGSPRRTVVPDVVGIPNYLSAEKQLVDDGFVIHQRNTATCVEAPGTVVATTPAPGTHVHAGSTVTVTVCTSATVTVPVTVCPTEYGITPSASDPKAPRTITIPTPPFAQDLAGYSGLRGYLAITAPAGWKCKSIEATDGGQGIGVTPPGSTTRESWGQGTTVNQPPTDGVFAELEPACQGCVRGEICGIVPSADADFPDDASLPCPQPQGQTVTPLGDNVYRIEDPAGALGPDAAVSVLRYNPSTGTADAKVARETCILPASERAVCNTLLAQFLTAHPASSY